MYFYQRAGFKKTAETVGSDWADAASHMGPGQDLQTRPWQTRHGLSNSDASQIKDLHGGWFDAGDYNNYTSWTAHDVIVLLRAYSENPTAFGDDIGLGLIKIAARVVEMKTMIRGTCQPHAPLRISCASLWNASRPSSPERRGVSPKTQTRPVNPQTACNRKSGPQSRTGTGASRLSRNHAIAPKALQQSSGDA